MSATTPEKPLFYVDGKVVSKRSIETKNDDGSSNFTLGFPVCEVSEWVEPETVAKLLELGEVAVPALRAALNHECLRQLLGEIEDSGTPESDKLWGLCMQWFDVRDAALALANEETE